MQIHPQPTLNYSLQQTIIALPKTHRTFQLSSLLNSFTAFELYPPTLAKAQHSRSYLAASSFSITTSSDPGVQFGATSIRGWLGKIIALILLELGNQ
jgi:hypothetical protein